MLLVYYLAQIARQDVTGGARHVARLIMDTCSCASLMFEQLHARERTQHETRGPKQITIGHIHQERLKLCPVVLDFFLSETAELVVLRGHSASSSACPFSVSVSICHSSSRRERTQPDPADCWQLATGGFCTMFLE